MQQDEQHLGKVIADIQKHVRPFLDRQDSWHGLQHVARVVEFAKQINQIEKGSSFLVEAGAWLHQLHDPNLHELKPILDKLRLSDIALPVEI